MSSRGTAEPRNTLSDAARDGAERLSIVEKGAVGANLSSRLQGYVARKRGEQGGEGQGERAIRRNSLKVTEPSAHVRFGSFADIEVSSTNVCFALKSRHGEIQLRCPLSANSRHRARERVLNCQVGPTTNSDQPQMETVLLYAVH
jgi:hypothetical protein